MPRITGGAPFFLVTDVVRAAEYYRDRLGFTIRGYFFEEPPVFAMVGRDDQIIMLSLMDAGRGGSFGEEEGGVDRVGGAPPAAGGVAAGALAGLAS
jgi:hypothetical protein